MSDTPTPPAPPTPAPPTPTPATLGAMPEFATWDAETQGAFKNHGWDAKPPHEAALEAMKSFRETQKHLGIPKDQIARIPKDAADQAGWNALWQRLGAGTKPEDYDLKGIKFADGTELDDNFSTTLRNVFHGENIPKDKAQNVARAFVKFMDGMDANEVAEKSAKLATEKDALSKSWGTNMEANRFIVKQAAVKLGWDAGMVDALEQVVGYEKVMQGLLKVGQQMGEDRFIANPNSNTPGIMTREQARAKLSELKADPGWVRKFNAGDVAANREFNDLTTLIAG